MAIQTGWAGLFVAGVGNTAFRILGPFAGPGSLVSVGLSVMALGTLRFAWGFGLTPSPDEDSNNWASSRLFTSRSTFTVAGRASQISHVLSGTPMVVQAIPVNRHIDGGAMYVLYGIEVISGTQNVLSNLWATVVSDGDASPGGPQGVRPVVGGDGLEVLRRAASAGR